MSGDFVTFGPSDVTVTTEISHSVMFMACFLIYILFIDIVMVLYYVELVKTVSTRNKLELYMLIIIINTTNPYTFFKDYLLISFGIGLYDYVKVLKQII